MPFFDAMSTADHEPNAALEPALYDLIVIGAGAAGLLAAAEAATRNFRVVLLEKNRKPGVKILMSGGTRCNLTHDTDARGIIKAYGKPGRFLHSALAALGPHELRALFDREGVPTKVEETGKVFPVSNHALDVQQALVRRLERSGAELAIDEPAVRVERHGDGFEIETPRRVLHAPRLMLTTGGQSYPGSGTTGDGFRWAAALGHTIVTPRPALVPLVVEEPWVRELSGITVPDTLVRVIDPMLSGKSAVLMSDRGSLLFTHVGLSGPVVLNVSRAVTGHPQPHTLRLECNFLPDMTEAAWQQHWNECLSHSGKKHVLAAVPELVPRRLAEALLANEHLASDTRLAELGRAARQQLVEAVTRCTLRISGTRGFAKAEVTAGGVSLDEVDSSTMQSKLVPGLYLAGEVLDLDGPIGGYNFQAAFSTAYLAAHRLSVLDR